MVYNRVARVSEQKSVLIVTPYFAPQSHAAVFRAYKLAKSLPKYGWKPYVLTTDTNYLYNEDPGLLDELPKSVEIHRARYIEPTARGLRMALGGRDRSFAKLKSEQGLGDNVRVESNGNIQKPSLYRGLLDRWIHVPDAYWTWYGPALKLAKKVVQENKIPIVYTTCLPYTCNQIGIKLKDFGCRWLADFRDPPTYSQTTSSRFDAVYLKQREIERQTYKRADIITGLSSSYSSIFYDMYRAQSVHFIPTGIDEELLKKPTLIDIPKYPYIVFAGEFLEQYDDSFFEVFASALQDDEVRLKNVKLLFVGQLTLNQKRTKAFVKKFKLTNSVEYMDHMPQQNLYKIIKGAVAAVLIPGRNTFWWTNFAKMVDFIGLQVPVLAILPDPSEARTQLSKAGLGIFLDHTKESQVQKIKETILNSKGMISPQDSACEQYLSSNMTKSFVTLFEKMLNSKAS